MVFAPTFQTLARSLGELLAYKGDDIEDVFMQTFEISYHDIFGSPITYGLREDAANTPVTQQNKHVCTRGGNVWEKLVT